MLTAIVVSLAVAVASGWVSLRARILVAFAAIVGGAVVLLALGSGPTTALGAAALMAAGSASLGGVFFSNKIRLAFGVVTALPFAFVAATAWSLARSEAAPAGALDIVILALAAVVTLAALSIVRPKDSSKAKATDPSPGS